MAADSKHKTPWQRVATGIRAGERFSALGLGILATAAGLAIGLLISDAGVQCKWWFLVAVLSCGCCYGRHRSMRIAALVVVTCALGLGAWQHQRWMRAQTRGENGKASCIGERASGMSAEAATLKGGAYAANIRTRG